MVAASLVTKSLSRWLMTILFCPAKKQMLQLIILSVLIVMLFTSKKISFCHGLLTTSATN